MKKWKEKEISRLDKYGPKRRRNKSLKKILGYGEGKQMVRPMELERQRKEMMNIGACFKCRKTGHLSKDCPTRKEGHKQVEEKSLGQQQPEQPQVRRSESTQKQVEGMTNQEKAKLLALMKEEETKDEKPAMMPEISSITIHNVIQADIENKSMTIPISILDRQERNIEMKALLDTGAGGKFINQNFVLLNQLQT